MIILILLGCPIAFALGAVSIVGATYVYGLIPAVSLVASTAAEVTTSWVLLAIPLFVFMAKLLETSGIAEDLFEAMEVWLGRLSGGYAVATVGAGVMLGAMMGAAPASTATMVALSAKPMQDRGYDNGLIAGSIASSGALSIIIPPSILMLVYASMTGLSPGALFLGGVIPGIAVGILFAIYIVVRCTLNPKMGPRTRDKYNWGARVHALASVFPAIIIILVVLGSIYLGWATPTEAAAMGAFASLILAVAKRKMTTIMLRDSLVETLRTTCFIMWIVLSASIFMKVVALIGTTELVSEMFSTIIRYPFIVMLIMQITLIILGCVLDPLGILLITLPVFAPIANTLGFDPLWFAILFIMNLATSFITPPFGLNLFVVKGMVGDKMKMGEIIAGNFPFFILYLIGMALVILLPWLATGLPGLL